jgi:hypothetical protein
MTGFDGHGVDDRLYPISGKPRVHPLYVMGTSGPKSSSAMIARLLQVTVIEAGQTVGSTLVARKLLIAM